MKRFKLSPLITLAMAFQLILSPVAHAVNPLEAINLAGQLIQQNQASMASQQQAVANQQLVGEMTRPGRDKYFNTDSLARVPGLLEYMAQNGLNPATLTCPTLPTTLTEIRSEVCRIGVTNDRGANPTGQLAEMFSLYKTYGDVKKQYEAYSSNSNAEGQGFGVGCMRNAVQTLNGFFQYRLNELDKLSTNLEALNNQFREASKVDLNAIEESTAVLDGGNSELADEVRTRRPDLFDFGKRFDNPACKSMYAGNAINDLGNGQPGGLNQISKRTRDIVAQKPAGSKFSGESYVGAHASVVEDINKLADKAGQQFTLNFSSITGDNAGYGQFLGGLSSSVSSTSGLNRVLEPEFFADAQLKYNQDISKINADTSTLTRELQAANVDPSGAMDLARNLNATNFEQEVTVIQNSIRNGCLQRSFGGPEFWTQVRNNIKDPRGSKFANKNEKNLIRGRIEQIMTNPRTTPEAKIAELRAIEDSEGSRFILNMQGSYQKTVVNANGVTETEKVSPSQSGPSTYFSNVISSCDAQFTTNKLGSTMTGAGAIQKLREVNQQYKALATNQANKIKSEIRRKLIECGNSNDANNSNAGSCTPERFNTTSPNFCANGAFTCSTNMNNCNAQAQGFVKQIKTERTARVNNYKALVQKNKADIVKIFDTALAKYMREGEAMRGLFGSGFSSPSGIQREVSGDGKYLSKFREATQGSPDGALMLEDPDKYVEMFKGNITKLKASVTAQQNEVLGTGGRGGLLAQHIDQTERNYRKAMTDAEQISNSCIQKHDAYIAQAEAQRAQQQQKLNELGEKRQQVCSLYTRAQFDANGACSNGAVGDLASAAPAEYGQLQRWCSQTGHNNQGQDSTRSVTEICLRSTRSPATPAVAVAPAATPAATGTTRSATTPAVTTPEAAGTPTENTTRLSTLSIGQLCDRYDAQSSSVNGCQVNVGTDERPRTVDKCNEIKEYILAKYRISNESGQNSEGPASPASCGAMNNSDRSVPDLMSGSGLKAIADQLGVQLAPSTVNGL